ncbi:MAG: hypothetical protein ACFFEJ_16735 [Candidatus Thorarchaeota archaeon]
MSKKQLQSIFGETLEEDIPLLSRWMLEQRMNIRHLIPSILSYAVEHGDQQLFKYVLGKCTPADVRDWIRDEKKGKVSSTYKDLINDYLYETAPNALQFWYHKYSTKVFQEIFDITHPHPDRWQLAWFQKSVYGEKAPEDSLVARIRDARKADEQTRDELEGFLKARIAWHYLSQTYPIEDYLESYLSLAPLRFVVDRVPLYRNKTDLIEIALKRLGLPECWTCGKVQLFFTPKHQYKCNGCGREFEIEPLKYAPMINVSEILSVVDKNLSPTHDEHQRALRMALLDIAQRALNKTVIDKKHIGTTAILIDKSGSMANSIELGITLGGLIGARIGRENVVLILFDTGSYPIDVPIDIQQMLYLRKTIISGGGTNIMPALGSLRKRMPKDGYGTMFVISDGQIFDNTTDTAQAIDYLKPKRVFFVKLGGGTSSPLDAALSASKSINIVIEPEGPQDAETVLGIASYFKNRQLIANLQGIREDILSWAEASWSDRGTIEYVKAKKCGNCYAPVPPGMEFCLSCGSSFE